MGDRVNFEVRAYPATSSPEGILLNYLKSEEQHPGSTKNDLVLKALKICWMPYAYREAAFVNKQQLLKIALATIHNLEWHIREIRFEFGLESVPPPAPVSYTPVAPVVSIGRGNPEVEPETEESEETKGTQKWLTLGL
ncbi:MAG TPA: hypothetical protein V6C95_12055 [Coleofasciculaceae cyanobacterium]